jgi:DNA-binding CsgD family transcriptional regulator
LRNFECVRSDSPDETTKREALWWSFLASIDLEDPSAVEFLNAYERVHSHDADDAVRLATGRLGIAFRFGRTSEALENARSASHIVDEARDAMVRSSFWNIYAWALTLNSRYEQALTAADRLLAEGRNHDLDFVVAHAALVSAQAHLGIRETSEASRLLDDVGVVASERADDFLAANTRILRARMHVAGDRPGEALEILEGLENAPQSGATRGECLAVTALALLLDGRVREARRSAERANNATTVQATQCLANLVVGIIASEWEGSGPRLSAAVASLWEKGQFDALVLAYRARPTLLINLAATVDEHDLAALISRARDRSLARSIGISLGGRDYRAAHSLSPREREVSALLAQGHTNAEIARTLYISEVTVKVHVRHILKKLRVRNRAEAAVVVARQMSTSPDSKQR